MILYQWRGQTTNFGDALNTLLWPRLLPEFFDTDPSIRFLGIGSVLDQRHPARVTKIVAGAGYGGYEAKPELDERWIVHWVRGPRTAALLGLPDRLAMGDPAALMPPVLGLRANGDAIGFMPHFESAGWGAWQQVADRAGVRLIDPRHAAEDILHAIAGCRLILSEALHGVIVADALRVPWIAIRPKARIHRAKWHDWAATADLSIRFQDVPVSTLREWIGVSRARDWPAVRWWRDNHHPGTAPAWMMDRAAEVLAGAARSAPQLSSDASLDRCRSRMLQATATLRAGPLRGAIRTVAPSPPREYLQADHNPAYQLTPIG